MCYEAGGDESIYYSQTWAGQRTVCWDLVIYNGTLTITGSVYMDYSATITVRAGATLKISGGYIKNADITVISGGTLIIESGGQLILDPDDNISIETGGILDYSYGSIEIE